ncbi:MAG: hypothetical protein WBV23_15020 [Desulfobaccales bacterium]
MVTMVTGASFCILGDLLAQEFGIIIIFFSGDYFPGSFANPLIWHTFAPLAFAFVGYEIAPKFKYQVLMVLCVFKIIINGANAFRLINYIVTGGRYTDIVPITNATTGWVIWSNIFGILLLILLLVRMKSQIKKNMS